MDSDYLMDLIILVCASDLNLLEPLSKWHRKHSKHFLVDQSYLLNLKRKLSAKEILTIMGYRICLNNHLTQAVETSSEIISISEIRHLLNGYGRGVLYKANWSETGEKRHLDNNSIIVTSIIEGEFKNG
jgi:hypothetical protein